MEILNNREVAIALWLIVISAYIFLSSKMNEVRTTLKSVLTAFFVRQIITVLCLMLVYMAIVIYWLSELDLWNAEQLKSTIFWSASVGFMMLFQLEQIKKDQSFFKHTIIDNLKLLAILQFIVGVYTFSLWLEILLVPALVLIGGMLAVAETDKKYHQVKLLLEYCLSLFGVILIIYTLYMLTTSFSEFGKERTVYDFFVPPLLTLCYFPFVFFMLVYSAYENVFLRLKFSIENRSHRNAAKLYAFVLFNVRISLLERWSYQVARVSIESHTDLVDTFKHFFKVRRPEKNPQNVPRDYGWSPYEAKDFLVSEGLRTGFYNRIYEEEWSAASQMEEFSDGIIPESIAYYVEGSEEIVKVLKLIVNVNDVSRAPLACEKLEEIAEVLSTRSLNMTLSKGMRGAISSSRSYAEKCGSKTISLVVEAWPNHRFNGYGLKLLISNV